MELTGFLYFFPAARVDSVVSYRLIPISTNTGYPKSCLAWLMEQDNSLDTTETRRAIFQEALGNALQKDMTV